jgi:hypothetical protein
LTSCTQIVKRMNQARLIFIAMASTAQMEDIKLLAKSCQSESYLSEMISSTTHAVAPTTVTRDAPQKIPTAGRAQRSSWRRRDCCPIFMGMSTPTGAKNALAGRTVQKTSFRDML